MTDAQIHDKRIELKYMLDASLSLQVQQWAREHLGIDRHCNETLGDSYDVNTLYLDTPDYDLFHRTGKAGRAKHRIRRYGDEKSLWIETKRKKQNVVRKNRTAADADEVLSQLSAPDDTSPWCGAWFRDRVVDRNLQPAAQVHYRRFARTATFDGESLRLTIDSNLQASPAQGWLVAAASDPHPPSQRLQATDSQILELKFYNHMPHLFKELLRTFAIPATGFSKYRTAVQAWQLDTPVPISVAPMDQTSEKDCLANA
ncbi:VTC domain protein [Rubripirellula lacrimiformis]|uniref:VTC domain protein n=1 Tax=Rubripirellula lacrimiformis TaxID=1930273 RepID=A0A517NEA6_9BACT|nr:polyphosphate polymerase domain-containing protein [Rubripirellula lacrimiformis]QDT05388.1 VTC domain protein [Rubripirellula lacrimiformis]